MTLGDMIDLVCTKMHRVDVPSRDEARKYIKARYQTIYESRPWRDVTGVVGVQLNATQTAILPHLVDRVISCRWGQNITLRNEALWTIIEMDPARFDQVGDPLSYSIMSPSGVRREPGGNQLSLLTGQPTPNMIVSIYGSYLGEESEERVNIAGEAPVLTGHSYDEVFSLSTMDETHDLSVHRADDNSQILFLRADERERRHQRLHFHSTPQNGATALILYKRVFRPLTNDNDAPEIAGIDQALLAFAISDMLEAQRHYSKAAAKIAEASALVSTMADLERHQSAHVVRIIPWVQESDDIRMGAGVTKGYWWG